jgi:hypothetical protein
MCIHVRKCKKRFKTQKNNFGAARGWWLTPLFLATQEAEIRRIMVQSQPGQIS